MMSILEGEELKRLEKRLEAKTDDQINFHLIPNAKELQKKFNVMAFPTNIIVDKNGTIQHIHIGAFESGNELLLNLWTREIEVLKSK